MTKARFLNDSAEVLDDFARVCEELRISNTGLRSLLISGVSGGEGTTSVVATFALMCARENLRVIAVNAQLRHQELNGLFATLQIGLETPEVPKVFERSMFGEKDMNLRELNEHLRSEYDLVLWDCPALVRHAEFFELAGFVDGVLLVLEADQTKVDALVFLKERLDRAKAKIVGAIINRSGRYLPNKILRRWILRKKKTRLMTGNISDNFS